MGDMTPTAIVELANNFGPFLFAILFIVFVTRTAHKWYNQMIVRKEPPFTELEERTLRYYFWCSVACGVLAMALSCIWWVYNQARGEHVYQVAIVELDQDEVTQSNYYNKIIPRPPVPGATAIHDAYFLIVQRAAFRIGDKFTIDYYKVPEIIKGATGAAPTLEHLVITYQGHDEDTFKVKSVRGQTPTLEIARMPARLHNWLLSDSYVTPFIRQIALLDAQLAGDGMPR